MKRVLVVIGLFIVDVLFWPISSETWSELRKESKDLSRRLR